MSCPSSINYTTALTGITVYQLTDLARTLDAALTLLAAWATDHWQVIDAARQAWDQRDR